MVGHPEIKICGKGVKIKSPGEAISLGLSLLPEDRKHLGLLLNDSITKNMTLSALKHFSNFGIVDVNEETVQAKEKAIALKIKAASLDVPVKTLSGGNQQKVVLGKCLMTNPQVLFLDEPTRGIDVGAKAEIYRLMNDMASRGLAVVMVSSELPEILGMSDRVLVMSEGKFVAEFTAAEATQEKIMHAATTFH
jgi:D-xylose transport system ATP-binding protein